MEFEKGTNTHISDFNRQIEESIKLQVKLEADKVVDENANVVKIMTIHKSKGLEFPVVIIAGMDKKRNIRSETEIVRTSEKMGIGIDIINEELKYKYPSIYKEIINLEKTKEEKEEEFRILYVAMTRAKEKLIMTAKIKSVKDFLEKINKETYINIYNNKLSSKYIMRVDSYIEMVIIALIEAAILQEKGNNLKISKQDGNIEIYLKDILNESLSSSSDLSSGSILNSNSNSNSNFKDDNIILDLGNIYIKNTNNLERELDKENIINISLLEEKEKTLKEEYIKISRNVLNNDNISNNNSLDNYKVDNKEGYTYNRENVDEDIQELLEKRYKEYIEEKENIEDNDEKVLEKVSVSAITTMEKKNIIDGLENEEENISSIISYDRPKFLRSEKIEGKEKGTILHSILELLDIIPFSKLEKMSIDEKKNIILKYIDKLKNEKIYSKEELEVVDIEVLLNYINTYIYQYLAKSIEQDGIKVYKEKTIYLKLTKKDIENLKTKYMISENLVEGQILQGVLDLYIVDEQNKKIYIVDYKTDKVYKEEYYRERYNVQIGIYEYSIFKQYGDNYEYNKIIYSTTMKKIIEI
ncbi:MAG: PD-(D/E)XK nuclease family protein [Clostridiales bacterium]|nr:PD-(D/E)XK nuclease family protein [Clostridiales bacterium]